MPKVLKWILTIILFVGLTLGLYFVGFKGEWIKPLVQNAGVWGYIIYIIIQVIITTIMCFVPATTFTFTLMSVQIFGTLPGFIVSVISCWISSMIMFLVGKYGGVKIVDWLVGKEDRQKAQRMISDRATVLVPVMLACPFFPDDAIAMCSGMTTMNFWYFSIVSLFTRSIGISATAFLGNGATWNYIKNALGNNIVLWIIAINLILFDVYAIWKGSGKIEQLLKRRREKKNLLKGKQYEEIEIDKTFDNRADKDSTIQAK